MLLVCLLVTFSIFFSLFFLCSIGQINNTINTRLKQRARGLAFVGGRSRSCPAGRQESYVKPTWLHLDSKTTNICMSVYGKDMSIT